MHLEDERIQRILHDEGDVAERRESALHLAGCAECARRMEDAEREERWLFDRLRQLDGQTPGVQAATVVRRARTIGEVWGRRAAGILLVVIGAGAAFASPLPVWVRRVAERIAGPSVQRPPSAATIVPDPTTAGLVVAPGSRFTIRFAAEQAAGRATVRLSNGAHIVARALHGAATFTTDVDRLGIENRGSTADYEIELPRGAPWVEIQVEGRRLFLKEGPR